MKTEGIGFARGFFVGVALFALMAVYLKPMTDLKRETERAREVAALIAHARGTVPPAMVFKSQICLVMETSKTPDGPWTPQGTENCDTSYARLRAR